jgi:hypothetical protein
MRFVTIYLHMYIVYTHFQLKRKQMVHDNNSTMRDREMLIFSNDYSQ